MGIMAAAEGLSQGGGLDDPLVCKLLVGRCHYTETRGCLIPTGHAGGFGGKIAGIIFIPGHVHALALGGLLL